MARRVFVDGKLVDKAGTQVSVDAEIVITEDLPFVSRGGLKLEGLLNEEDIDVTGLTIADVGSSTGGFTDCLLKRGAKKVFCIDVGKGLLDWSLRNDERVVVLEGTNIRNLTPGDIDGIGEGVDLAVIDVSFISLKKILKQVSALVKEGGELLALIKPQFEVGKGEVGKGGIVREPEKHKAVVSDIKAFATELGFSVKAVMESPIKGTKGNKEFMIRLGKPESEISLES